MEIVAQNKLERVFSL